VCIKSGPNLHELLHICRHRTDPQKLNSCLECLI